ncbi:MAG: hypothetical protein KDB26_13675 [Microthrixaceae bacterium]|nr:hypothetical protein [Microthrixaceae bacterium]
MSWLAGVDWEADLPLTIEDFAQLRWYIGRLILDRLEAKGRGSLVLDRLAADLRTELLSQRGWTRRILHYMRNLQCVGPGKSHLSNSQLDKFT